MSASLDLSAGGPVRAPGAAVTPPIPLSLYVHLPWCVRKCPYCDFNSHARPQILPEALYLESLLRDLEGDLPLAGERPLVSIYFGGGTPNLLSPRFFEQALGGIASRMPLSADIEVTLEANPGAVEVQRFSDFRAAGINRLSVGVQSFDDGLLRRIGRIHDGAQARAAITSARCAGFDNINVDLMFALPGQTLRQAAADVDTALACGAEHISHYQLTLEPGTAFWRSPPRLPREDAICAMQEHCSERLEAAGLRRYEVSAYACRERQCTHNRNYWEFGDYLGIGAGAHGKLTTITPFRLLRTTKSKAPDRYMEETVTGSGEWWTIDRAADRILEFMINALRLTDGVTIELIEQRTGVAATTIEPILAVAQADGLVGPTHDRLAATAFGLRYLDELLQRFVAQSAAT